MFKKAWGRGKFFCWTYQELPIIRKCKEGRQAAWLPPSLLQKESRKSEIYRPIAVWGIQSQLQCVEHIHVFFFSYPPVCLICMSTNRFQLSAREKGNVACDDLPQSPCVCLIMDVRPLSHTSPPICGSTSGERNRLLPHWNKSDRRKKKARADGAVFAFVQTVLFSTIHKPPLWAQVSQMYLEHAAGAEAAFCWSVAEVLIPRCLCTCISISFFFFISVTYGEGKEEMAVGFEEDHWVESQLTVFIFHGWGSNRFQVPKCPSRWCEIKCVFPLFTLGNLWHSLSISDTKMISIEFVTVKM